MTSLRWILSAVAALALAQGPARAAETRFDFEEEKQGWITPTSGATVALDQNAGEAKAGRSSLVFDYPGKAGDLAAVLRPDLALDGVASLDFWVRSSVPAVLAVFLEEKDGSRYQYAFSTAPGRWQRVVASLADFTLADDSQDENSALDAGQVQQVAVLDAGLAFAGVPEVGRLIPQTPGARKLWLDEFRFAREAAAPRHPAERIVVVDGFDGGVLRGLSLFATKATLARVEGADVVQLTYTPGKEELDLAGIVLFVAGKQLVGTDRLRVRLRSTQAVKLALGFEERDGSRYNAMADLPAGTQWHTLELPLTGFTLDENSTDENGRLDLAQAKTLAVVDATALAGGKLEGENVITIDEITLVGPAPASGTEK